MSRCGNYSKRREGQMSSIIFIDYGRNRCNHSRHCIAEHDTACSRMRWHDSLLSSYNFESMRWLASLVTGPTEPAASQELLYPASAKASLMPLMTLSRSPRSVSTTETPMCPTRKYLSLMSLCSPAATTMSLLYVSAGKSSV